MKPKTYIKTYTSNEEAEKYFKRYKKLSSKFKTAINFSFIKALYLDKNQIAFQYIDIKHTFAESYKNKTYSSNMIKKL